MKKITFFNYLPLEYGGGTARYFRNTAIFLKQHYPELHVDIVTFDEAMARRIMRLYAAYFMTGTPNKTETRRSILNELGSVRYRQAASFGELSKLLRTASVIYSKNDLLEAFFLKYMLRYSQLPPVVFGFHTPVLYDNTPSLQALVHNRLYSSVFYHNLIRDAKKFHVLTQFDAKLLRKHFPKHDTIMLPNPFDFAAFSQTKHTDRFTKLRRRNTRGILWVGRLTEQKGVTDLINIIERTNKTAEAKAITWMIAGEGELKNHVLVLAERYTNVHYAGYVQPTDMADLYRSADLLLCTSKWETFPYTLLEATAFSLPIIAYPLHGVTEIVAWNPSSAIVTTIPAFVSTIQNKIKKHYPHTLPKTEIIREYSQKRIYSEFYRQIIQNI